MYNNEFKRQLDATASKLWPKAFIPALKSLQLI